MYHTHVVGILVCHLSCVFCCEFVFCLGTSKKLSLGDMMSAQNTHDIPVFYHVFVSFHIVISVVIALYLILGLLCTSSEKGGIWRLYGDLKKENGEPSSNIATSQRCDVRTSRR